MSTGLKVLLLGIVVFVLVACEAANTQSVEIQESDQSKMQAHRSIKFSELTALDDALIELSGMISVKGRLFAHNDSGDGAFLYEVDSKDGSILRKIPILDAWEADWEDIAQDDKYVYIGDIGNNIGKRHDLRIYKIEKTALLDGHDVHAQMISISYGDQHSFKFDEYSTPYDAEGLIAFGDSLYIFTKNWADYTTRIYVAPKEAGTYVLDRLPGAEKRLDVMVTAADIDPVSGKLALVGYTDPFHPSGLLESKLMIFDTNKDEDPFSGEMESFTLSSGVLLRQYEAVTFLSEDELLVSGEGRRKILPSPSSLYRATISLL